MAFHTELPIYKVAYDLLTINDALHRVEHMPAAELFESGNSYFGLLRQATHSHHDRTRLAGTLRRRGHRVNPTLTKTYQVKIHG